LLIFFLFLLRSFVLLRQAVVTLDIWCFGLKAMTTFETKKRKEIKLTLFSIQGKKVFFGLRNFTEKAI
jgi:hypothetical protein